MKKIRVNERTCIGCGNCVRIDSEHFVMDYTVRKSVPKSQKDTDSAKVEQAIEGCPVDAISLE